MKLLAATCERRHRMAWMAMMNWAPASSVTLSIRTPLTIVTESFLMVLCVGVDAPFVAFVQFMRPANGCVQLAGWMNSYAHAMIQDAVIFTRGA